jgi:hypothetical protein
LHDHLIPVRTAASEGVIADVCPTLVQGNEPYWLSTSIISALQGGLGRASPGSAW